MSPGQPEGKPDLSAMALERGLKSKSSTGLGTSQHATGEARGMATPELAAWARDHLAGFDQITCECHDPRRGPNPGWALVSPKSPGSDANRRQCLSYVPDTASARLVDVPGLQASA